MLLTCEFLLKWAIHILTKRGGRSILSRCGLGKFMEMFCNMKNSGFLRPGLTAGILLSSLLLCIFSMWVGSAPKQSYIYSIVPCLAIAIHMIVNFDLLAREGSGTARSKSYRIFLMGIFARFRFLG